jgi:GTP-binding protein
LNEERTESSLIDYLEVEVRGGKGGSGGIGIQKMQRSKTKPDGADGGDGGAVLFRTSRDRADFKHIPSAIIGRAGGAGGGKNKRGEQGSELVVTVPVGTIVGCQQSQRPLAELVEEDELFLAARGGRGGRGNRAISGQLSYGRDRYHCREKEEGEDGQLAQLYLEMKVIADIGLVGLPNAGKSSLLRAISGAKPKVASYPFTTLRPHVGVIHYDGYFRVRMADIPGLIEGSSLGHGLGFSFLRHIDRCKSLLYVVDMSNTDCDPIETIQILERELEAYKAGMTENIVGIVANKIDLLHGPEKIIEIARAFPQYPVMPISALKQRNIIAVRNVLEPFKYLFAHYPENDIELYDQ